MNTKGLFLTGKKIGLRGLCREDADGAWFNWFNDSEATRYMYHGLFPNTREGLIKFYEESCVENTSNLVLAIIQLSDMRHVGNVGLHRIDHLYRRVELGIILGERDVWGQGYGSEACSLICGHAFKRLNLHKIYLRTEAENKGAIRAFEKAGFAVEAILKEELYRDGAYRDVAYMSMFEPYHPPRSS